MLKALHENLSSPWNYSKLQSWQEGDRHRPCSESDWARKSDNVWVWQQLQYLPAGCTVAIQARLDAATGTAGRCKEGWLLQVSITQFSQIVPIFFRLYHNFPETWTPDYSGSISVLTQVMMLHMRPCASNAFHAPPHEWIMEAELRRDLCTKTLVLIEEPPYSQRLLTCSLGRAWKEIATLEIGCACQDPVFNLLLQIVSICDANIDCFVERLDNMHLVNTIPKLLEIVGQDESIYMAKHQALW